MRTPLNIIAALRTEELRISRQHSPELLEQYARRRRNPSRPTATLLTSLLWSSSINDLKP
jgi:hypothetical protein